MNNKKATKRALLTSVMALAMCVVMLIGTTFAWFTDSATANVNRIQSGTLKVDIVDKDNVSLKGKTLSFRDKDGGKDILWEPGATFVLDSFRIVNKGNLALKYKVGVNGLIGDAKLLEVIDFTVSVTDGNLTPKDGVSTATTAATLNNFEGTLLPETKTGLITISGKMQDTANNDYQNLTLDGISISVVATQLEHEFDSNGNDYDSGAVYCEWPVVMNQAIARDENGDVTGQVLTKTVANKIQAQVEVPAEAIDANAENLVFKAERTTAPANFTIGADRDSKSYEVTVTGLKNNNTTPLKAKLFVGVGLSNVTFTHNGDDHFTKVDAASFNGADKTYYYDAADGYIYFASATFSPFSAAFDAPVAVSDVGTMDETYYNTSDDAQAAADEGKTVTALKDTDKAAKGEDYKKPAALHKETVYYTVADAVKAQGTSGSMNTIKLLRDVTEEIVLPSWTTLDLNSFVVSGNVTMDGYCILKDGTIKGTVTDCTTAAPSNNDKNALYNCNVDKFVLADGCNRENVLIEKSTIGEAVIGNRYYSSGAVGLLTFKDSHVTGNISVGSNVNPQPTDSPFSYSAGSKVRFIGGTYDGSITLYAPNTYNNTIEIVEGIFAQNIPSEYLNAGSAVKEESGKYIAYRLPAAKVGETEYASIEEACTAAMTGSNHEVVILRDGNVETSVDVTGTLVFDLNGHTVQAAPPTNRAFIVQENGDLTIRDSSSEKSGLLESISSSNAETVYIMGGGSRLTVESGTIKSPGKPIASQVPGNKEPFAITIKGGTVVSTGDTAINLAFGSPVNFRMEGGIVQSGKSYCDAISIGSSAYKADTGNVVTIVGGQLTGRYGCRFSGGGKIATTFNIAQGMTVTYNECEGVTVNSAYSE